MESRRSFIRKSGLLMAVGSLPLTGFAVSTDPKLPYANKIVTLYVDTGSIDKQDVNASCNFGQPEDISNEDFTIVVNVGDTVTWQGVSTSSPSTDVVDISAINHEGGKNVFGQNVLQGNGQSPEKVIGTVINRTEGNDYKYKISFKVSNNGAKRNGTFHIDPKMQAH